MAAHLSLITVKTSRNLKLATSAGRLEWLASIKQVLTGMISTGGNKSGSSTDEYLTVWCGESMAFAANTITFSDHATAGDTVKVGGVVFTGQNSLATAIQFIVGSTATATAANLAAKINAHYDEGSELGSVVLATSSAGVLTITSLVPGTVGNQIGLAKSCSVATIGGSGLALEGGGTTTKTTIGV